MIELFRPLVEITRGSQNNKKLVEAIHLGAFVVVDGDGTIISHVGDPEVKIHLRSVGKPFQLLPFINDRLHEKTWAHGEKITLADLALMMASHSGDEKHVQGVERLLAISGIMQEELLCGVHFPYDLAHRDELIRQGKKPTVLHNNCSGKHIAMLMVCKNRGWSTDNYTDLNHPLQQDILAIMAERSGIPKDEIGIGIDGCSVPTFVLPLQAVAKCYAQLPPLLYKAGTSHPELLGGQKRLDTALMCALPKIVFAKTGAEGVFAMSIAPNSQFAKGLGIIIKIADGDPSHRARPAVATRILQDLGLLPKNRLDWPLDLQQIAADVLKNFRGLEVGTIDLVGL